MCEREVQRLRTIPYFALDPPSVVACQDLSDRRVFSRLDYDSILVCVFLFYKYMYVFVIATLLIIIAVLLRPSECTECILLELMRTLNCQEQPPNALPEGKDE